MCIFAAVWLAAATGFFGDGGVFILISWDFGS